MKFPLELSIEWLREKYLNNEVTPEEVIEEIINRAMEDSDMNIWITPPAMENIKPYLEKLSSLDKDQAPLWGIPFAIKDNIDLAGIPTTAGCPEYAYTPREHAAVVERLIEAGAIPVGKANLDQFATGLVGTRSPYGETQNALRRELISGGSSSGSAVSVARGQASFSLGTDTAGSGRVPAMLNRLVGYKPTLGAWSTKGVVPACASLDCVTTFTNSLEDALVVDGVARGVHADDPWSRNIPKPTPKLPEKICLPKNPLDFYGPYAKEFADAWGVAVSKLEQLNIPIEYVDTAIFSEAAEILYGGPYVAERWADLGQFVEENPGATFPVTEEVLRSGSAADYDAASVFNAMHKLQTFKLEAKKLLENAVLVMPTAGGTWTRDQVREDPIKTNSDMGKYTNHCNLLDLSAVAVPSGDALEDTPFGITFFSLADSEGLICGVADSFSKGSTTGYLKFEAKKETTPIAVCGLHMRGFPLEKQMKEFGAQFIKEAATAQKYEFIKLLTEPEKPGLIKKQSGGSSIKLEVWEMPIRSLGGFAALIPAPLGIGKVELEDGSEIPGFICEGYAEEVAENITALESWHNVAEKAKV